MEKTHADRDPHPRPAPPRALERSGSFVWFELRARDPQKAAALFQHVVGCKLGEMPMGNTTYTLLETDQR